MSLGLRKAPQFYSNEPDTGIPSIFPVFSNYVKSYLYFLQSLDFCLPGGDLPILAKQEANKWKNWRKPWNLTEWFQATIW